MTDNQDTPVLWGYFRSSASYRVRIALNWKGIAYEQCPVHLVRDGGEQHGEAFRALNPLRQVPALSIDGLVLVQSLPIIEYLEETRPERPLLPPDPRTRAVCRQIAETINSGIQPLQNLSVLQRLGTEFGLDDAGKFAWAAHWIERGFDALETMLQRSAGECCVGDQVTLADVVLVPQVFASRRFGARLERYPLTMAIHDRLAEHPAFAAAHPSVQPDAV